jgi:hypothetical protein
MSVNVGSNENDRVNKGVSQADIKGCRCKNVSDVSRRVTCVSGVCQLWGDLPTDRKTTSSAKLLCGISSAVFTTTDRVG